MENSMEDYKKISDSVKSYSDIELDLIKRGLVDFSKKFLFYKYFLEEFGDFRFDRKDRWWKD